MAERLCALAGAEFSGGGVSGAGSGDGPVWAAHEGACNQATAAVQGLRDALARAAPRSEHMRAELNAVSSNIADRTLSMRAREDAYRRHMGQLRDLVREASSEGVATSVSASFSALSAATTSLGSDETSAFSSRQAESLRLLDQSVQGMAGAMGELDRALRDEAPLSLEIPDPPSVQMAVLRYAHHHVPQIAIAIGVDVAFLFFLCLLQLNRAQIRLDARERLESALS